MGEDIDVSTAAGQWVAALRSNERNGCTVMSAAGQEDLADTLEALAADSDAARREVERLTAWKGEACEVIEGWELVWSALGEPGALGEHRSAATLAAVEQLRADRDAARAALTDAIAERDEALAEVERLRGKLQDCEASFETVTEPMFEPWEAPDA